MNGEVFLVDTNVLVYAYDLSAGEKYRRAKELLLTCWEGKQKFAVSSQNLSEFFSVASEKKILSKQEALITMRNIVLFNRWVKINFTHMTALKAAVIAEQTGMSVWDSLLAETMRENGIFNIYTEDVKGFKVPWLHVVNPFERR